MDVAVNAASRDTSTASLNGIAAEPLPEKVMSVVAETAILPDVPPVEVT